MIFLKILFFEVLNLNINFYVFIFNALHILALTLQFLTLLLFFLTFFIIIVLLIYLAKFFINLLIFL